MTAVSIPFDPPILTSSVAVNSSGAIGDCKYNLASLGSQKLQDTAIVDLPDIPIGEDVPGECRTGLVCLLVLVIASQCALVLTISWLCIHTDAWLLWLRHHQLTVVPVLTVGIVLVWGTLCLCRTSHPCNVPLLFLLNLGWGVLGGCLLAVPSSLSVSLLFEIVWWGLALGVMVLVTVALLMCAASQQSMHCIQVVPSPHAPVLLHSVFCLVCIGELGGLNPAGRMVNSRV